MQAMRDKKPTVSGLLGVLIGDASKQDKNPDDATVLATIKSFLKNNAKLQEDCKSVGNTYGIAVAEIEVEILSAYLPKQLTLDGLRTAVKYAIEFDGATNLGQVMKYLKTNHEGRYDGKAAKDLAEEILNVK